MEDLLNFEDALNEQGNRIKRTAVKSEALAAIGTGENIC